MLKRLFITILCVSLSLGLVGFDAQAGITSDSALVSGEILPATGVTEAQARNLQKLCKVWGFAKYTHKAFLFGLKNWDQELLNLIPVVCSAKENQINDILYEWFIGLGDNGYADFDEKFKLTETDENRLRYMANMDWLTEEYLGKPLASVLSQFCGIPSDIDRTKASVSFDHSNHTVHNENTYPGMDYSDNRYRLLGLFSMWNAMEYYFPYLDIIDYDWNELLLEHIPMMLNVTDKSYEISKLRRSYEKTLASLASKLDDAHILFKGSSIGTCANERYLKALKDNYRPSPTASHVHLENNIGLINPSKLQSDEIHAIMKSFKETNALIVDLRLYPSDPIAYSLANYLVEESQPAVVFSLPSMVVPGVFEDNAPQYSGRISDSELEKVWQSYLKLSKNEIEELRTAYLEYHYLDIGYSLDEFKKAYRKIIFGESYYYDKKVVLLMDETTISQMETTIMSLCNGSNVTVIGRNSIGANGNITYIPLPGGISMSYSGLGVYYPDSGQTQRIGLSPDIYIERTEKDVKEGRDELMAAAVQFILK